MGSGGTVSIGIQEDNLTRHTSPPAYASLLAIIRNTLRAEADSALMDSMISECHQKAIESTGEPARDDELLYFVQSKARTLANAPNIRNHLAVLRKAVPYCFSGEAFRIFRQVAQQRAAEVPAEPEENRALIEYNEAVSRESALWTEISERHREGSRYDMQAIALDPDLNAKGQSIALEMIKRLGRYTPSGL